MSETQLAAGRQIGVTAVAERATDLKDTGATRHGSGRQIQEAIPCKRAYKHGL